MYDVIGDIHGYADELQVLLELLGYDRRKGYYSHPRRRAIFVGDLIDRGPKIRETLQIVRSMVAGQSAVCVMGNHEFNAIAFHTRHPSDPDRFLRRHHSRNIHQHSATLRQLSPSELYDAIEWFRTLPLWYDANDVRVIHACWHPPSMTAVHDALARYGGVTDEFLYHAADHHAPLFESVETLLKGLEIAAPEGYPFRDKEGIERRWVRTRWFIDPANRSYRDTLFEPLYNAPDAMLPAGSESSFAPYPSDDPPLFFGHYWMPYAVPSRLAVNVACLDYSVARDGFLCAYRWSGEQELCDENFVRFQMH